MLVLFIDQLGCRHHLLFDYKAHRFSPLLDNLIFTFWKTS